MQGRCLPDGAGVQRSYHRGFPWVLVSLAAMYAAFICVFGVRVWHSSALPRSTGAHHSIYNDLERSAPRMLMPYKRDAFPVLGSDAISASEVEEGERLPGCVGVGRTGMPIEDGSLVAGGPLAELPLWALPDDNAGLESLAQDLVCLLIVARVPD